MARDRIENEKLVRLNRSLHAAWRDAVRLAIGGDTFDAHRNVEVQNQPLDHLQLLVILLAEKSDVDFLVELEPEAPVGLFKLMEMQFELEDLIGRKVDLRTPQDLHERFRDRVVAEAEPLYVHQN